MGVTYDSTTGLITVPAGVTSFTITTPTVDDALKEETEFYDLSVGGVDATGTILDNEGDITVTSVTSDTKTEGTDLVHTVTLSGEADSAKTYTFSLANNTTEDEDYTAPIFSDGVTYDSTTGLITVPAGVTSFTITTPTVDDALKEETEFYDLSVGGVDATGTILDNEGDITVTSVTSDTKTEGTDLVHTVTLSGEADSAKTYTFSLANNTTEDEDYTAPIFSDGVTYDSTTGLITVPAGVTSFTITTPTVDDALKEETEFYDLSVGGVDATGTILDNEGDITVTSVTSDTKTEGTDLVHTVTLSGEADSAKTYTFSLANNTTEDEDYTAPIFSDGVTYDSTTGLITVPAGVTSFTITTPTVDDALKEETEFYDLSVGGVDATGTILDNEGDITVTSVTSDTKTEGTDLVHTVTLSGEADSAKTYTFSLANNTTEDEDYTAPIFSDGVTYDSTTGLITVPAGVTSFTITTPTVDDALKEETEFYDLSVGGVDATGTILDNEIASVTVNVSEEGLVDGIADNSGTPTDTTNVTSVNGSLDISHLTLSSNATFELNVPTISLTSNGDPISWELNQDKDELIGKVNGEEAIKITIDDLGNYTIDLSKPIDHLTNSVEDILEFGVGVTVTDGSFTTNTTIDVNIEDDMPSANSSDVSIVSSGTVFNANVVLTLDYSGSMNGSEQDQEEAGAIELLNKYKDTLDGADSGDVKVMVVKFAKDAVTSGSPVWMSIDDAIAYIEEGEPDNIGATTNYDDALKTIIENYDASGKVTADGTINTSYFMSDGKPGTHEIESGYAQGTDANSTTYIGTDGEVNQGNWEAFLEANSITSYALGIGSVHTTDDLKPIAYDGVTGEQEDVNSDLLQTQVDFDAIGDTLVALVPDVQIEGDLNIDFGADGAADGVGGKADGDKPAFTWGDADSSNNLSEIIVTGPSETVTWTLVSETELVGTISGETVVRIEAVGIDTDTPKYKVTELDSTIGIKSIVVPYTITDADGDSVTSSLNLSTFPNIVVSVTSDTQEEGNDLVSHCNIK